MLKIITVPNSILTTTVLPVTNFDISLVNLISEMEKTLKAQTDPMGVGLAAPQVNVNLQIFIMKPKPKSSISVFINPKIIQLQTSNLKHSSSTLHPLPSKKKKKTPLEGCLSIPRIWGPVKRSKKLLLEYQTPTGEKKQEWFSGFEAVIIQHEVDHLNGVLFTQRALEQKTPLYEEQDGKLKKMDY
jgi:peptide deformylase